MLPDGELLLAAEASTPHPPVPCRKLPCTACGVMLWVSLVSQPQISAGAKPICVGCVRDGLEEAKEHIHPFVAPQVAAEVRRVLRGDHGNN